MRRGQGVAWSSRSIVTTAVSLVLAAGMGIVAWRLARAERMRSAARVAALAADLHDVTEVREQAAVGIRGEPARVHQLARRSLEFEKIERRSGPASVPASEMFRAGATDRSGSRLATVLAVGGFAVATSLALVIATSRGGGPSIAEPAAVRTLTPARPADAVPLELVALSHDRDGDRITIRGVVRNPHEGANVDRLAAVVYVFDREGEFLGNGRAAVDVPALAAGCRIAVRRHGGSGGERRPVSSELQDRRPYRAARRPTQSRPDWTRQSLVAAPVGPYPPQGLSGPGEQGMMHSTRRPLLLFGALLAALAATLQGQQSSPPERARSDETFRFRSGVELINVTTTVSDASGRFVPGLQKDDFLVYEDDRPVEVSHFSAERVPVSLGIALDTSGSMAGDKIREAESALNRFTFELLDKDDEMFLYRFSNYPTLLQGWTTDRQLIGRALGRLTPNGGTALYDAVDRSPSPRGARTVPEEGSCHYFRRQRHLEPRRHPRREAADSRERGPGLCDRDRR